MGLIPQEDTFKGLQKMELKGKVILIKKVLKSIHKRSLQKYHSKGMSWKKLHINFSGIRSFGIKINSSFNSICLCPLWSTSICLSQCLHCKQKRNIVFWKCKEQILSKWKQSVLKGKLILFEKDAVQGVVPRSWPRQLRVWKDDLGVQKRLEKQTNCLISWQHFPKRFACGYVYTSRWKVKHSIKEFHCQVDTWSVWLISWN